MPSEVAAGTRRGESIDSSPFWLCHTVCKKCKGKLHRLVTTKKQTRELQESIIATLPSSMQMHSLTQNTQVTTPQVAGSSIQGTPKGPKESLRRIRLNIM